MFFPPTPTPTRQPLFSFEKYYKTLRPQLLHQSPYPKFKMTLVAGSYEHFIWGFHYTHGLPSLDPIFSYHAHPSFIKAVAVAASASTAVSSGGNDETIKLYDLASSTEIGSVRHASTITSLSFSPHNLIAAADTKGSLSVYLTDPFLLSTTMKTHTKGVNSLSVHPSGKWALTVGRDEHLALVDLEKGKWLFSRKLSKEASIVQFDKSGDKFFIAMDEKIEVHDLEDEKSILELHSNKSVTCATPGTKGILFTGGEDKNITAWDTASGKVAYRIEDAHTARVKGIVVLSQTESGNDSGDEDTCIVATASSDGVIRVWDVRMGNNPLAQVNTKARLTCLAGSSIKCKPPIHF